MATEETPQESAATRIPRSFSDWFDREVARKAEAIKKIAESLRDDLTHLIRDLTDHGENAGIWVPSVGGRAAELASEIHALRVLKELREHKRGFEAVEADTEQEVRAGSAFGGFPPPPPPQPKAARRKSRKKP